MKAVSQIGFTLIETVVALVVAATVAAAVLGLTSGMYRRAMQSRAQTDTTIALINDSVMVRAVDWRSGAVSLDKEGWQWQPFSAGAPALEVNNIELSGAQAPPEALAYTPFQRFGVRRDARNLWFIAPALLPPGGTLVPAAAANSAGAGSVAGAKSAADVEVPSTGSKGTGASGNP